MDQHGFSRFSPPRDPLSSINQDLTDALSPADEKLIEKHESLLKGLKRLPAHLDHRFSLRLGKARDEITKPAAFARLLARIGMTPNEADKRLINARSKRVKRREFKSQVLPRVGGYSTLAALASLKDEPYARLLNGLESDAEITKAIIASVAKGN